MVWQYDEYRISVKLAGETKAEHPVLMRTARENHHVQDLAVNAVIPDFCLTEVTERAQDTHCDQLHHHPQEEPEWKQQRSLRKERERHLIPRGVME